MPEPNFKTTTIAEAVSAGVADSSKRPAYRVLGAMLAEHWLMLPQPLEQMAQIALRLNDTPEAVAAKLGRPLDNSRSVTVRDGVAIVPISGPIFRHANMMTEVSGATSLEVLASDLQSAVEDPAVSGIVLEIDSPGGQAAGIADMAGIIGAIEKPVVAYVDNNAASAAYWMAAAADEIVISRAAMLGSVGVVLTAKTMQAKDEIQIVSTQSPKKRPDLNTETGRAQVQSLVDDLASVFVSDVAQLRGIDQENVLSWEGGLMVGQKAVDAGMADRISDLESVIAGLSGSTMRKTAMTVKTSSPEVTRDTFAAEHPAIADALRAEGRDAFVSDTDALMALPAVAQAITTARAEGATEERERIHAVEEQGNKLPGFSALITGLKYDGKTTGPEAAVALLAANGEKTAKSAKQIADEAPDPVQTVDHGNHHAADNDQPVETRCKAQWEADPATRAGFSSFETFLAYTKATESGRVRIIGGKS